MACCCIECCSGSCTACAGPSPMCSRYIYGTIFLFTNLFAWVIRDYSDDAFMLLDDFKDCLGNQNCFAAEGVLRLSFGCFAFFFLMYLTTVGTSRIDDPRDAWHRGCWPVKFLLWIALMILPFFIPSSFVKLYGEIARFGAGIFLGVQLLCIINFVCWWNERWIAPQNLRRCFIPLLMVTSLCYILAVVGIVIMYIWFTPHLSCSLNIFFITWTAILMVIMTIISLDSKVNAGLMTSALISLYIVFLCWSAIMSEPKSEVCNTRPRQTGKTDLLTVLSFFLGVMAIVFATFSTGADKNPFATSEQNNQTDVDKHVPYSYGFFHFVFAVGSMYFAMLFLGWNLHQTMYRWSIDVGWASVWVKIAIEWLAAGVYIWTMISPFLLKNRGFS